MQNRSNFRLFVSIAIAWSMLMLAFALLWSMSVVTDSGFNGEYNSPATRALGWTIIISSVAQITGFTLLFKSNLTLGIRLLAAACAASVIAIVALAGPKVLLIGFPFNLNIVFIIATIANIKRRPAAVV